MSCVSMGDKMSDTVQPLKFRRRAGPDQVIIIGGGLAGLFTALSLAPLPVIIITPKPLGQGASSAWAQGGIAAAIGEGDTPENHAADTIAAGDGLVDAAVARLIAREASDRIEDLLRYGVPFDRDLEGRLRLSRESAHSARRIVRVNGDQAGKAVMATLIAQVSRMRSITVLENVEAIELIRSDGVICGVKAARNDAARSIETIYGRAVVLATGGSGHLFRVTTNPPEAGGTGIAIAARAGAVVADTEFMQFHPTAFDIGRDPAPLASEALRGDGALLINRAGKRFMPAAHPAAELAPRDVVARAVHREIQSGRGAFLDCRMLDLEAQFPGAYAVCRDAGIDPRLEPIPVAPAAHYHMGGVVTDIRGRTSLTGLWACGEVAATGAHGANRLASNSLLEAVVFGARVAQDIASDSQHWYAMGQPTEPAGLSGHGLPCDADHKVMAALRGAMSAHAGVERYREGLAELLRFVGAARAGHVSERTANMLTTALLIAAAAYRRTESRGGHFRTDYPQHDEKLAKRTFFTLKQAEAILRDVTGGEHGGQSEGHSHPRPVRRRATG